MITKRLTGLVALVLAIAALVAAPAAHADPAPADGVHDMRGPFAMFTRTISDPGIRPGTLDITTQVGPVMTGRANLTGVWLRPELHEAGRSEVGWTHLPDPEAEHPVPCPSGGVLVRLARAARAGWRAWVQLGVGRATSVGPVPGLKEGLCCWRCAARRQTIGSETAGVRAWS